MLKLMLGFYYIEQTIVSIQNFNMKSYEESGQDFSWSEKVCKVFII